MVLCCPRDVRVDVCHMVAELQVVPRFAAFAVETAVVAEPVEEEQGCWLVLALVVEMVVVGFYCFDAQLHSLQHLSFWSR